MDSNRSEAEALAGIIKNSFEPRIVSITDPRGVTPPVPVLQAPAGLGLTSVKKLLDEYLVQPERRRGTVTVTSLDDYLAVIERFKDGESVIFADATRSAPSLTAVFNYNASGAQGVARWGDHRAKYAFPLSDEWKAWTSIAKAGALDQLAFAGFIEEHINDVLYPDPQLLGAISDASVGGDFGNKTPDEQLAAFAKLLGGKFALPQDLVKLSQGLQVFENTAVKDFRNLNTGTASLEFTTEHQDGSGNKLEVPNLFLIGVPVFHNGPAYRIAVKLRYRLKGGSLSWFLQLHRSDKVFDHAFDEACEHAQTTSGLPLYQGAPESRNNQGE